MERSGGHESHDNPDIAIDGEERKGFEDVGVGEKAHGLCFVAKVSKSV